ncbi:MAG: TolC family protein [Aureliella sp.]
MIARPAVTSLVGSLMLFAGCSANPFPRGAWNSKSAPGAEQPAVAAGAIPDSDSHPLAKPLEAQTPDSSGSVVAQAGGVQHGSVGQTAATVPAASFALATEPALGEHSGRTRLAAAGDRPVPAITAALPLKPLEQLGDAPAAGENAAGAPQPTELPPGTVVLTLDNVLQMAEAQNPQIRLARERINEAYARALRANALWLPSLRTGLNYNHHEGTIQDVAGTVFPTNRSAFYGGLGAGGVGANSPAIPGLMAQFHFADALFQPEIASHQAAARQFSATATRNDTLRDVSVAYLELSRAEHSAQIAQEAVANTRGLLELTQRFAEIGQGLNSDFTRMQAELAVRLNDDLTQQESVRVASARLAQLLHADSGVTVVSGEPVVAPLDILNSQCDAATYVAEGLMRRPELAEQKHLVCEAVERMRREKFAPLMPSVLLGMSYGAMGGGLGSSIVNSGDRWDADAIAYWELRNLGVGEQAARRETASQVRQAQLRKVALLDQVAREVVEAHARVTARRARIELAESGIVAAEKSYQLNRERIENAQGLPIEVLQSIQALTLARRAFLDAVTDYNIAQFQLCHATGALVQ